MRVRLSPSCRSELGLFAKPPPQSPASPLPWVPSPSFLGWGAALPRRRPALPASLPGRSGAAWRFVAVSGLGLLSPGRHTHGEEDGIRTRDPHLGKVVFFVSVVG